MTTLRNFFAIGATAAAVAVGYNAVAQDDLDALLGDLEVQETPAKDNKAKPAAPAPAAKPEAVKEAPAPAPAPEAVKDAPAPAPAPEAVKPDADGKNAQEPKVAPAAPAKAEDVISLLDELEADVAPQPAKTTEAPKADEAAPATPEVAPAPVAPTYEGKSAEEVELIEKIRKTQELRFQAFQLQAERQIKEADRCMLAEEFQDAARNYAQAMKLLNSAPRLAHLRKKCEEGIAEGLYRAALQEDQTGRRERALKFIQKAIDCRHPKARRQYEAWVAEGDPDANKTDISEISHRRNDDDFKARRAKINRHLKRSQQFLAVRDLDRALDECELVLLIDNHNQEAIRLRDQIQQKRRTILKQERKATRDGMIADVDEAWRPVYAKDARDIENVGDTTKTPGLSDNPERSIEQNIIKRMQEMRLPAISFKPPATLNDAIDYFRQAAKDHDRPDIPLEQRGFNFYVKPREVVSAAAPAENAGDNAGGFGVDDGAEAAQGGGSGVPVIPMISASDITFYDALKLVCEAVEYKFTVKGPIVTIMHKSASVDEMHTRSFPVLSSFIDRMDSASSDVEDLRAGNSNFLSSNRKGGNEASGSKETDWKEFFSLMGVNWPEGSSLIYIKTLGKLHVKNTLENLALLENALNEMNANPTLIEIETRFVEVCQDDLNSLGFEWILNSDYSLNLGNHVTRALGIKNGEWDVSSKAGANGSSVGDFNGGWGSNMEGAGNTSGDMNLPGLNASAGYAKSSGASWIRGTGTRGNVGINSMDGKSGYGLNNRYLSTLGNHISGEGYSTNDQFMRVNAFLGSADLSMILHMLSQRSDTDLLSAPKVLTRSGEQAVIKVVTEYIYPTDYDVQLQSSSSSGGGSYGGSSQSAILAVVEPSQFTMREVGVILDVTPELTDNGNLINLQLNTQVVDEPTWKNYGMRIPFTGNSSLQSFEGIGGIFDGLTGILESIGTELSPDVKKGFAERAVNSATSALDSLSSSSSENITYYDAPMEQPFFHVRSIESKVTVYPGATIVMGGLITEQRKAMDDKVPFLGDIPFLGRFFRSHAEQSSKRNLLIFVTTRLVDAHGREVTISSNRDTKTSGDVKPAPAKE